MNVLSLFDGMSCGQIALDQLNIKVNNYYASEVDKFAIKVAKENYPNTIHLGDVREVKATELEPIDLLLGGSPCQGFSFAGKQLNFDDPRSALFFEYVRLLKETKPKYFLLENVRMKQEYQDVISEYLGVKPIMINSSLLSAQNRVRLYWTNIPNIEQPKDLGLLLKDVLEDLPYTQEPQYLKNTLHGKPRGQSVKTPNDKARCLSATMWKGQIGSYVKDVSRPCELRENVDSSAECHHIATATDIKGHDCLKRVYSPTGKAPCLNTMGGGNREPKVLINKPQRVGTIKGGGQGNRIYSADGKGITLSAQSGGKAGNGNMLVEEPKVLCGAIRGRYKEGNSGETEQRLEIREDQKTNTLTTVQKDNVAVLIVSEATKKGYTEIEDGDCFDATFPNSKTRRGRNMKDKCNCLTAANYEYMRYEHPTYRKLTPIECERLQTVPDNYTSSVSKTQRYKMLGNGWTVDVVKHILANIKVQ